MQTPASQNYSNFQPRSRKPGKLIAGLFMIAFGGILTLVGVMTPEATSCPVTARVFDNRDLKAGLVFFGIVLLITGIVFLISYYNKKQQTDYINPQHYQPPPNYPTPPHSQLPPNYPNPPNSNPPYSDNS
jgi:hypothetical protein